MRAWAVTTIAVLNFAVPAAAHPSFDCARASTKIEKLICEDPYLAMADRYLANVYRERLAKAPEPEKLLLKQSQRRWLEEERAGCIERDNAPDWWHGGLGFCLMHSYDWRIDELEAPLRQFVDIADDSPLAHDVCRAVADLNTLSGLRRIKRHALQVREVGDVGKVEDLFDPAAKTGEHADDYESIRQWSREWRIFAGRVKLWADKPESWVVWTNVGSLHNPNIYLYDPRPPGDKPARFLGFVGEEGSGPFDWLFVRYRGQPLVLVTDEGQLGIDVLDLDWNRTVCPMVRGEAPQMPPRPKRSF